MMNNNQIVKSSELWVPDQLDGTFQNPIIYADYSDPDVIRVGEDFFMIASSFNCMPGLPLLHSKDLVNWTIINHVIDRLPFEVYDSPQYGKGVWAPSLRYHDNKFWVFFCTPDEGIFLSTATDPWGVFKTPILVKSARGWIDPCPFWDEDGKAYLANAFAGSRTGFGSVLNMNVMKSDGSALLSEGEIVFDGNHNGHHTIEGPKLYKRNGYYYIFAPAGGVVNGWQTILRSRYIFGPYEDKIVLHQGNTAINGPHQGGMVELENGDCWFMHFQDRGAYGRILHLQPVSWVDDWPVMGEDINGDGIGEPVSKARKPVLINHPAVCIPETSDDFDGEKLGLQWQWNANWREEWYSLVERPGHIRLYASNALLKTGNTLWHAPNVLLQKLPAPNFAATTKVELQQFIGNQRAGLAICGDECCSVAVFNDGDKRKLGFFKAYEIDGERVEDCIDVEIDTNVITLRVNVVLQGQCRFSYSLDGEEFFLIGDTFQATKTLWTGAKVGIYCINTDTQRTDGHADFDWFCIAKTGEDLR